MLLSPPSAKGLPQADRRARQERLFPAPPRRRPERRPKVDLVSISELKARLDFRQLVEQSHAIDRGGKVLCPFHDDTRPSCHVYPDGFKCFACGAYGDHLDWLERVHGLSTSEAIERLTVAAHGLPPFRPARPAARARVRDRSFKPISPAAHARYRRQLARTRALPRALWGRGLDLEDARTLGLAAVGDDALLPIPGPRGDLLALKRRFAAPRGRQRYLYTTAGHGSPAWCSPEVGRRPVVLVVEGELNGMVAYLALQEAGVRVGVIAPAGASGSLPSEVLSGKEIYLYADGDAAGDLAKRRWQAVARRAGAMSITPLPAFDQGDACDLAARHGRRYLAAHLLTTMYRRREGRNATRTEDSMPVVLR